ncbi:thioesterase domain-containing protein [Orenia metallireducens]|uniref:Thioesterase domain-containing protein n=1 Tax=Orenia metallireducens TaxID=1413210 RepID=A0A285HJD8_9FIRM|nr:thioesterase domain-containing protein [Orenia metallireducens]PRX27140.1 thioesterase domain-containing protein [Orenia metallireducens]SNY34886.1 Thioesterase domain-containing protein [Orenia metallireducens]
MRKSLSTFIKKYSVAKMLQECGIEPDSIYTQGGVGEYVASCISGILSLEDALGLLIGVINNNEILLNNIKFKEPETALIPERDKKIESLSYWKEILEIKNNKIEKNIKKNLSNNEVLIEIGSKNILENITFDKDILSINLLKEESEGTEIAKLLNLFGSLWTKGLKIDWGKLYSGLSKKHISLPTYPFDKQRFWIEPTQEKTDKLLKQHDSQVNELNKLDVEQKVIEIWEEFLGEEDIKVNDNYFDLGGESLSAVEIVSELQNVFKIELALNEFMDLQTPKVIAEYIMKKIDFKSNNKLIGNEVVTKIQQGKLSIPIFLVHPAGGSILCYHQLKRYLSDNFTIYGIQFPESRIKEIGNLGLKEVAAEYVKELKKIRPEGPYLIGGYSFGGNAAYEMALQLEKAGDEVFDIFMMDSLAPMSYYKDNASRGNFVKAFPLVVDMYINHNLNSDFQVLTDKYYRGNDFGKMFDAMKEESFFTMNVAKEDMEKFFEIWEHNHRILGDSTVDNKFSGNIVMFNAVEKGVGLKKLLELLNTSDLPKEKWQTYIRGKMEIIDVPGDHFTLFGKETNIKELATKINSKLNFLVKKDD